MHCWHRPRVRRGLIALRHVSARRHRKVALHALSAPCCPSGYPKGRHRQLVLVQSLATKRGGTSVHQVTGTLASGTIQGDPCTPKQTIDRRHICVMCLIDMHAACPYCIAALRATLRGGSVGQQRRGFGVSNVCRTLAQESAGAASSDGRAIVSTHTAHVHAGACTHTCASARVYA